MRRSLRMHDARYAVCLFALLSLLSGCASGVSLPTSVITQSDLGGPMSIAFSLASSPELVGHRIFVTNVSVVGKLHEVVLDTGSSDLWVDTTLGTAAANSVASTIVDTGVPALLEYGVESAYTYALGNVQYASVELSHVGGKEPLVVLNQPFVNVPGTTNITQYGNEGILGLAPPGGWSVVRDVLKDTDWDADPFLATMFRAHSQMQRIFTLSFGPRDAEGVVRDGVVTFGAVPPELSAILNAPKVPLMTGRFWDVPSRGFVVDGDLVNLSESDSGTDKLRFILDSGVYATFAPPEYLQAIYSPVPGSFLLEDGTWSVPCDTRMNVSIFLGGAAYEIHPIDMTEVYALEEEDGTWKPLCKGLFQSNLDTDIPFLIGLNVLRNLDVLHYYGEADGSSEPYVQIKQAQHTAHMNAEFEAMNAARINAFFRSMNVSVSAQITPYPSPEHEVPSERPMKSAQEELFGSSNASSAAREIARRWYFHAVFVSCASFAVLYSTFRRLRFRCQYTILRV